jgi:small subunit ribosomal protein S14
MAKLSKVVANNKKKKLISKYYAIRQELKAKSLDANLSDEERWEAQVKLQKLPKNSSPVRHRSRCVLTGHSRAVYRKFGLSRVVFRDLALQGMLPGVTKASW